MGVRVREEEKGERTNGEWRRLPQKKKGRREGRILRLELTTGLDCDQGTIARNHMRYERFDSISRALATLCHA